MMYHQRMRTTVDLPEHLLVEAKKLAADRRVPLTRVFEESVRSYLSEQRVRSVVEAVRLPLYHEPMVAPGVDLDDTSGLLEME